MDRNDIFRALQKIFECDTDNTTDPVEKTKIGTMTVDELEQKASFVARQKVLSYRHDVIRREMESLEADISAFWKKLRVRLQTDADHITVEEESGDIYECK